MKLWITHTGSAPGCQDTPTAIICNWFEGQKPKMADVPGLWKQLLEFNTAEADNVDAHNEHCFNQRKYALSRRNVADIVRRLKAEYEK